MESFAAIGLMSRVDPTVQARRQLCLRCPYRVNSGIGGDVAVLLARVLIDEPKDGVFAASWCAQCKCYLPLKTRMRWAHCPLSYW